MFKLDNDFLVSLGLGSLPVEEKNKLLQAIYERLEMNVGMRLAEKMTDAQLGEFEGFIDRNDESGALRWLESNFPNYKDVVAEELEKLKQEVRAAAPQILATAQQAAIQPSPAFQAPPVAPIPTDYVGQQQGYQPSQPMQPPVQPPIQPQMPPQQPYAPQSPNDQPTQPQYTPPQPMPPAQPTQAPVQPSFNQPQPDFPSQQPPAGPQNQPPTGFPPQQ